MVVKRNDFSNNDILNLRNRKLSIEDNKVFGPMDVKIVFVSPSGHTEEVLTSKSLFNVITDGDDSCIIYGL